ncbi:MAG: carboxypeptidase-like regulatory domain-containing protein [Gemmatimonadota bacterium]|nr:carboxypeptidase-like regulatory domain-containing protein [Gemmatimonadota bacterium]
MVRGEPIFACARAAAIACAVMCGGAVTPAGSAGAQGASVGGRVFDVVTSAGIAGAEVILDDSVRVTRSDSSGRYRFDAVPRGAHAVLARSPGFGPVRAIIRMDADAAITRDLPLKPVAGAILPPVTIIGASGKPVPAKLAGFEFRRAGGIGRFLTEDDFGKIEGERTGNVLSRYLTGIKLERAGGSDYVATTRMQSRRAFEGTRLTRCFAQVYVDGVAVYSGTDNEPLFDVNTIPAAQVAAVEFYAGPGQMPIAFNKTGSACGVLLIWTK